jgi:dipeptidyl aminopeptidase/acylaminoacyl peptidase
VGRIFGAHDGVANAPRPGVLFIHGYGSSQRGYWPRAGAVVAATGATCLTFDLSGHGESAGSLHTLSEVDHERDALAAYDYLVGVGGIDRDRIGVCGASYGGYLAAVLVSQRRVSRLLLRAPALGRSDPGRAPAILTRYSGEVFVVESELDEVVSKSTIATYLGACEGRARHHIIRGATHELKDLGWRQEFLDLVVDWFRDL